ARNISYLSHSKFLLMIVLLKVLRFDHVHEYHARILQTSFDGTRLHGILLRNDSTQITFLSHLLNGLISILLATLHYTSKLLLLQISNSFHNGTVDIFSYNNYGLSALTHVSMYKYHPVYFANLII